MSKQKIILFRIPGLINLPNGLLYIYVKLNVQAMTLTYQKNDAIICKEITLNELIEKELYMLLIERNGYKILVVRRVKLLGQSIELHADLHLVYPPMVIEKRNILRVFKPVRKLTTFSNVQSGGFRFFLLILSHK